MGMRSPDRAAASRAAAAGPAATAAGTRRPPTLTLAAVVTALEAAGLCVAGVFSATDTAAGQSYHASSGIAFTAFEFIVAAGVTWIAFGIARMRPWSRTPAVMTQVITGVVAIYLLQAHRFGWGIPALVLAVAGLAGLLAPASLRALTRSLSPGGRPPEDPPA
jgi:hypothetical protein